MRAHRPTRQPGFPSPLSQTAVCQPLRRSRLARLLAHAGMVLGAGWLAACSSVSPGTTAQNNHGAQLRHGEPVLVTESEAVRQLNAASQAQGDDGEVIVSNDLWDRIRAGFAMPELDSPLVARHEQYYLSRPDYLQRMFGRGSFYLHHIVEEVERRGMPTELALLPFVESAMNPSALSSAKAAGLWQFIPATGKRYDLNQNWWVDNRRDVVQSTRAALDYLQTIYQMNGDDWFLALASYNWGEGAVRKAVRANQAAGKPADYAHLRMPNETRNYVPKLLALKHIVLNARQLGLQLPNLPDQPYFVTVEKTRPIDLKLAARFAGMTEAEFLALNPAHNRPVISASRNNTLKIPVDRIDRFKAAMAEHAAQKRPFVSWQPHTLQPGESLAEIASRGGLTVPELLRANGISAGTHLLAGTRLLVPTHRVSDENLVEQFDGPRLYQQVDAGPLVHRVRRGETGTSIARRYGLTLAELRTMNRRVSPLKPGMTLTVRRSQKQTVLVAEDGSRKVISRQVTPAAASTKATTASSGSHSAIRLVHYSPARSQTESRSTTQSRRLASSRSTASRLDSRVTLRSDRSATHHTLRQSGKTTVALADTTSRTRSATARKSTSAATATGKRLKATSATSRGSASSRSASAKAASAKSASSRKALTGSNTRASGRSTATRSKASGTRTRGSHKVADAR